MLFYHKLYLKLGLDITDLYPESVSFYITTDPDSRAAMWLSHYIELYIQRQLGYTQVLRCPGMLVVADFDS